MIWICPCEFEIYRCASYPTVAYWPFMRGIHPPSMDYPHSELVMRTFDVASIVSLNAEQAVNSSSPGQNGRHLADDIFKCNFLNEKFCILIQIALKFVPEGTIDNKWALVQVMAWRRTGDKPSHNLNQCWPSSATHIYGTRGGGGGGGGGGVVLINNRVTGDLKRCDAPVTLM